MTADSVVITINGWIAKYFPQFKHSIVLASSGMVITEPVADLIEDMGVDDGLSVVDYRIFVHYYRTGWLPDARQRWQPVRLQ